MTIIALGATALTGFSQGVPPSGSYSVVQIPLPVTTLDATVPAVGVTNIDLSAGWSSVVSVTNTSTTWNSSSNAFISTTNIVSATNTTYADIPIQHQKEVAFGVLFNAMAATTAQIEIRFSPGLDSTHVDTNLVWTLTRAANGTTQLFAATNLTKDQVGGYGIVRINQLYWRGTNAVSITNLSAWRASKLYAW